MNSDQLFRWRRQLLPKAVVETSKMGPVEIAPAVCRSRRTDCEGFHRNRLWLWRTIAPALGLLLETRQIKKMISSYVAENKLLAEHS